MPTFEKHPFVARAPPVTLKPESEVFYLKATAEIFTSYEDYVRRLAHLRAKHWSCSLTGRSNLSFEEALQSERSAKEQIAKIPAELEPSLVKMVHHSCLSHDALVSALYQHATSNSKETPDKKGEGKKLLKLWLAYAAKCKDKIWRISNESLLQAHSLPDIVPQELIDSVRSPHKSKGLSQDGEDAVTAVKKAKPPKVLLSLEEEEKRLKPGSAKHAAFHLLKDPAYSLTGITGEEVIRLSEEKGIKKDWSEKALDTVKSVLSSEVCFCKVSEKPSRYALTNMPGVVPMVKKEKEAAADDSAPKPKNKVVSQADDGPASSSKTKKVVSALLQPSSNPADASNSDALSKAESKLQQMKGLCQKHEASVKKAELFIEELETNLKEAVERESSKSASQADKNNQDDDEEDEWAGAPSIELPDDLKEYRGDPTDRKAQVAFNKKRQEAERELRSKRESWIMEQRKLRLKGKGSSVAEIRAKIKQATGALDTAKKGRDSSLAALKDAELAVDRERQRKMLKEVKEQGKTSKEEEKERLRLEREKEIERRKNDPLTKLKFPIDDNELHQILLERSRELALPPPVSDPALASSLLPPSPHLSVAIDLDLPLILSISDLVTTFKEELGIHQDIKGWKDLSSLIDNPEGEKTSLSSLYLSLLSFILGKSKEGEGEGTEEEEGEEEEGGDEIHGEDHSNRVYQRWRQALDNNTWTEVLRLFLASRGDEGPCTLSEAREVLGRAASGSLLHALPQPSEDTKAKTIKGPAPPPPLPPRLTRSHHLAILSVLCEEAMGCHSMRVVLGKRLTESVETTAAIRAELMNERKKLRELEEGAREAKKRKREAELIEMQAKAAKMHEEAVEKAKQGDKAEDAKGKGKKLNQALAAAAAKGGGAGDEGADPAPPSKKMKKVKSSASVADLPLASSSDPLVDLEPSFDLPDDLREFKGSPGDKKGLVTFRHRQQKEKARLDKLKAEWDKERKTREREREATRKAEEQEERRREKGMKAAEEAIQGHLEALEAEAERLAIRRPPLGTDRFHRKYWWGLGGYKEGLLIECPQEGLHGHDSSCSAWVRVEDEGKIQAFLDKLDQRGYRESELKKSLSRVMPEIKQLLGKSPPDPPPGSLMEVDPDPVALTLVVERRVQPGRRGKPTDLTDGIKKTEDAQVNIKNKSKMEVEVEEEGEEEVREEAYPGEHCLMQCLAKVDELAAALSAAKATGPPGGWRVFRQGIKKLRVQDHDQQGMDHDQRGTEMIAACREKLGEIEALLADATGNIEVLAKAEDEMEVEEASEMKDEEEVVESDETDVPKSKWGRYVWRSRRERRSWLKMLEGAGTAPRLAYLANVLSFLSSGPVAAL